MGRHPSNPSRREFLTALAGTGGALLRGSEQMRSAEVDPRVALIVSRTIAVDMLSSPKAENAGTRCGNAKNDEYFHRFTVLPFPKSGDAYLLFAD